MINKIIKVALVIGVVVLASFSSCKKAEVSKDETASFLTGLNSTATDLTQTQAYGVLNDFIAKNPPIFAKKKTFSIKGKKVELPYKISLKGEKGGISDYYGTWAWADTGWIHQNPDNPSDGILFTWTYTDSTGTHQAGLLIDSIQTQVIGNDTLPTSLRVTLTLDNRTIAEFTFNATYDANGNPTYLKVVLTIPSYVQVGFELKNTTWVYNQDYNDYDLTSATFHLWVINYQRHNYRIDFTITVRQDKSISITLTDSEGWNVVLNASAPQQVQEGFMIYEKITVSGEITKDGRHAADISGTIWIPEDENHKTEIYVIFSDGSREPLENYITLFSTGKK